MRKLLVALCAMAIVVAGCGSDSDSSPSSSAPPPSTEAINLPADSKSSTPPAATDDLTGFGATVDIFAITHKPSQDSRLAKGCCYGPLVTVADGESVNEYNLAANTADRVLNLTRNFATGTTQREALAAVLRDDLPRDVQLTKSSDQGPCKVFVYRSATLGKSAPSAQLGPVVSLALYPPPDLNRYDSSNIEQVIELVGDGTKYGC